MTRFMYDGVNPNGLPNGSLMVAGYVDGRYANMTKMIARFPHAVHVGIAVSHTTDDGQVIDVENGDATPEGAVSWVQMRRRAGADPTVYCNYSTWAQIRGAFKSAHIVEPHYWIAEWDGHAALIGGAVAKQYANGKNYDSSIVADNWPGVDGVKKPVPVTTPAPIKSAYIVKEGDTLSGIATKYGLSLETIEKLNPQIHNPSLIYPGDKVYVSGHVAVTGKYTVKPGDTMSSIAEAHHITLGSLEAKNHQVKNFNLIYPGDVINL